MITFIKSDWHRSMAMERIRVIQEELESLVKDLQSGDGQVLADKEIGVLSLQNKSRSQYGNGSSCIHPIDDIREGDTIKWTEDEKLMRCKLASLYRLVDLNGWSQKIYNHISLKVDKEHDHFLINSFGLKFHEVTASNLIKIDLQGDIIDPGTSAGFRVNKAGYVIHSAIHAARPDINCVIHVHLPDVIAVSAMDCGLLLLSQESCVAGNISYHDYQGIAVDEKERKDIVKDLGPVNKVMILRNHGMLACGGTVEEAFHLLVNTVSACKTQVKILSCVKLEDLKVLDQSILDKVQNILTNNNVDMVKEEEMRLSSTILAFEADMRLLDDLGYKTGHVYKDQTVTRKRTVNSNTKAQTQSHGHTISIENVRRSQNSEEKEDFPTKRRRQATKE